MSRNNSSSWLVLDLPAHPIASQLPLIGRGFNSSLFSLISLWFILTIILPAWMKDKPALSTKAYYIIWSGFLFGFNGAGFLVTFILTDSGINTVKCNRFRPIEGDVLSEIIAHGGVAYYMVRFVDLGSVVFAVLAKKTHSINYLFIQSSLLILLIQSGVYSHPGGLPCFIAIMDTITGCFTHSYLILSAAHYFNNRVTWKCRLLLVQCICYLIVAVHAIYFLIVSTNCNVPPFVHLLQASYGLYSFAITLYKLYNLNQSPKCPRISINIVTSNKTK